MPVIDADSHIDENEETWSYLRDDERWFKPNTVMIAEGEKSTGGSRYWHFFDNLLRERRIRDDARTGTTLATRELLDIDARLRHMDEMGVDVHVIYPTCFLTAVTARPDVDAGLCRSYNRWLSKKCAGSGGRLRWVAQMPVLNIPAALEEIEYAKDNGAAAIMKKGLEAGFRVAGDPYFYPLYDKASELDIAVCLHAASGDPAVSYLVSKSFAGMFPQVMPVAAACSSMLAGRVPDLFPKLRVGFIEAGASWVPYILDDQWARHERQSANVMSERGAVPVSKKQDLFKASRFYVAYQTQEDLDYLLKCGLEDCLVVGTDYTHADQSADISMLKTLNDRAARGEISPTVVRKMLEDNPARLYGLQ
jgi:predicted TIM-barrel fold metal-dependent hydrolase